MGHDELVDLIVDLDARAAYRDGQSTPLTRTEFAILVLLLEAEGAVLTHARIAEALWGSSSAGDEARLAAHVHNLRGKLGDSGARQRWVRTVHGVGYALGRAPHVRGAAIPPSVGPGPGRSPVPQVSTGGARAQVGFDRPEPESVAVSALRPTWVELSVRLADWAVRISGAPELVVLVENWWSLASVSWDGAPSSDASVLSPRGRTAEDHVAWWLRALVPPGWSTLSSTVTRDAEGCPQQVSVRVRPQAC